MEPVKVDSASNGVGTHVGKHDPIPIPQERQRMLSDNGVQTITCGTKQSRPTSQMTHETSQAELLHNITGHSQQQICRHTAHVGVKLIR